MAGALSVRLGGTNYYKGHVSHKPFIGDKIKELEKNDIKEAINILYGASFVYTGIILLILGLVGRYVY